MRGLRIVAVALLASVLANPAVHFQAVAAEGAKPAKVPNFVDPMALDLATLLPPAPAADSPETEKDLAEIHAFEKARTPEREKIAKDDENENVFAVVHGDLGPAFTAEKLPVTAAFFKKVLSDESVIVNPAKNMWGRKRPAIVDPSIKLCVKPSTSYSYPSGHGTIAYLSAIVLSDMLPDHRRVLFDDAARFSESRIICGLHYRSDIVASRVTAALMAQQMRANPVFRKEFAGAQAELRAALEK